MSLRDQVRGKRPNGGLRSEVVRFPADHDAHDQAHGALQAAQAALLDARQRGLLDLSALEQAAAEAQAQVDALEVVKFDVRALPPEDWELLVAEHPAPPDAKDMEEWNPKTFHPALIAVSVTVGGEASSEEEWVAMRKAGDISPGEFNTLVNTAIGLNLRTPSVRVGKD